MFYRYEFVKDDQRVGILTGLDDFFTWQEVFSVCGVFEINLETPNVDMDNTRSYFTDNGNRKFRKGIRKIQKLAASKGIRVDVITTETLDNIVYSDRYQVVIRTPPNL